MNKKFLNDKVNVLIFFLDYKAGHRGARKFFGGYFFVLKTPRKNLGGFKKLDFLIFPPEKFFGGGDFG